MASSPRIVKQFEDFIKYAVAHEGRVDTALAEQTTARPWMDLAGAELTTKATEKKETEIKKVLKRDDANQDYETARADPDAKSKQIALAKLAGDFLAACERDKRAQWRTRLRMVAHAVSRHYGNGQDSGPLRRNTLDYLSRIYMKAEEVPAGGS